MSAFDEWRNKFLISINSDEFGVLDECLIYVEQIALFNQICTYSNKTDSFLIDTLKPTIDNILKYEITSQNRNKLGDITNFLKKSTVLLEWAFVNDRFNLFEILNRITDRKMELYKSIKKEFNGKCLNLEEIIKYVIEHEYLTIMLMKIQKEANLQIDHFLFFIQTFNKVHKPMNENSKFSLLFGFFEPFQNFLSKLNETDVKDIKTNKLEDLFSDFCTLASIIDADIFQGCVEQMTILASNFFLSPDFDNQKVGCSLFKVFTEAKNEENTEFINNTFIETLSKIQIIPKILSHSINSENFELISPLIEQISSTDHVTGKDLVEIWESFIKTDKTDYESVINTILCILKQLKFSEVDNFFKAITIFTEKSANLNEDQKEKCSRNLEALSKLVLESLIKRENMNSETAQLMFDKLLDSAEQYIQLTNNQPDDCLDLKRLYAISKDDRKNNNSNINRVRKELLKNLHSRFNKQFQLFIVRLLANIAEKSNKPRDDFEEKDIDVISKYIIELNEKNASNEDDIQYALYPLYAILMNEYNKKINSKILEAMLKSPSDALWNLLCQIMDESNLDNFEEDAIQCLSNFILHNYMQKSTLFLNFLKIFILLVNEKNGVIEIKNYSVYEKFRINKTPLLYEEVLEKIIIETDDESIVNCAIDICVCIYSNYASQEEVILKLLKIFKDCIDDANNQNIKMKMNIINLIFKYCQNEDKNKIVSLISHKKVFKKSLKDKTDGNYTINFKIPDSDDVQFKFSCKEISMHTLYLKISPFLHSSIQNYCICKKIGDPLSLKDKISFQYYSNKNERSVIVKEIKDGVIIENTDDDDIENTKADDENKKKINGGGFCNNYEPIPSEYLVLHNITKSLFNILNHFDNPKIGNDENQIKLDELVYEFLSYLPTDPDLFVLSDMPDKFIPEKLMTFDYESFMNNKYSIQYILQILLIRFNCKKYIEVYKNEVQQLLLKILAIDSSSLTFVTYMINEILRLIELLDLKSDDFILLLIRLLSLSSDNNSDECKLKIVTILEKLIENNDSCNISDLICNHIDIFNSVLTSVSNKVWEEFRNSILFKLENPETLFKFIMNSLLQCNEEDMMNQINRYYSDIFSYYFLKISNKTEDASEINNIVKILMKMLRINPTSTIIDNFDQIVNKNAELLKSQDNECSLKNIINCLISIIRLDSKPSIMNKIVELLLSLALLDNNGQKQLNDFAEQISAYKIKGWNQMSIADQQNNKSDDDDEYSSISNREKGLKNLNQTCYMNSALQQFYHIPAFRYFISNPKQNLINNESTENKDDDDNNEISIVPSLSLLFTSMELSKKSEINPEEFFTIFSSKHADFELGKQQDCQEFVDYFIDDIKGEAHNLFEWKILTKYQRKDNNQEISSKEETFVSIPLSVESGSMKDSIKEYFTPQKLTGDNLYELSNGTKMEAILIQKIITAPSILIFQLKRFKYDKEMQNRVKINKKFEILNNVSIKQYMLNSTDDDESYNYILNGVVVHAGNGSHGHYTSLIKEDIQSDNWLRYDDSSVSRIKTRKEFENLAFGDDDDDRDQYGTNGYLLFYARENATVDVTVFNNGVIQKENKFILDNSFPSQFSRQAELSIENDNSEFLFNQCVLEKSTFAYMVNCASSIQMLKYFFGIFVHAKMFDKAKEIEDSLLNNSKANAIKDYLQFMVDENNFKNYILPVFSEPSNDKMEKASFNVINKIISSSVEKELAGELVQNFINNLKCIHKKWNRVCHIGSFIINYINDNDKQCIYPVKNAWEKFLLEYIFYVHEDKSSNNKNIDISTIFESLGKIISLSSARDPSCLELYLKLPSINEKVKETSNYSSFESYKSLIVDCISSQIFTVSDVREAFGDDFSISFILHHQIEKVDAESFLPLFYSLMSLQNFTAYEIIDYISEDQNLIQKLLVPNLQLLADILVFKDPFSQSNDMKVAKKIAKVITDKNAFRLTMKLEYDEELKLFNILKSEILKIDIAYRPFFTVFNYLIKSLNIPPETKIEGLEDLISRSGDISNGDFSNDNTDMINVEIYFHQDKLTERCAELLDDVISSKSTDNTYDTIIQTIELSGKNPGIFAQIVSLPAWKNVTQNQSSSHNYSFINKLATTLNKIQNEVLSNVKKEDTIVRFSLVNALVYLHSLIAEILDNGDHKYYTNVLYFEPLIDELFKNSRECINQRNKNEVEVDLYLEPDFKVILDFDSYLKIIENMIRNTQRNNNKDTAMRIYSNYIVHLIEISNDFAQSIEDDDSEKLKSIKQFIEKAISSIALKPEDVLSATVDSEKDSYILCLIKLTYTISKFNEEFSKEMDYYIKKKAGSLLIMPLFKLKFCLQELINMPEEKCSNEIVSFSKKVRKHREAYFELLLDFIMECKNHNLIKSIVNALLIDDTQMNEKSFMTTQINRDDASNSINEKTFFELSIQKLTDEEFDDILNQVYTKFKEAFDNPDNYKLMQVTTKFLVMMQAKPEKKDHIRKLIPDNAKRFEGRPGEVIKLINQFN